MARREHYIRQIKLKEFMEKYIKEREESKRTKRQREKEEWDELMVNLCLNLEGARSDR